MSGTKNIANFGGKWVSPREDNLPLCIQCALDVQSVLASKLHWKYHHRAY